MRKDILATFLLILFLGANGVILYTTIIKYTKVGINENFLIDNWELNMIIFATLNSILVTLGVFFKRQKEYVDFIDDFYPKVCNHCRIILISFNFITGVLLFIYFSISFINQEIADFFCVCILQMIATFFFWVATYFIYYDED